MCCFNTAEADKSVCISVLVALVCWMWFTPGTEKMVEKGSFKELAS